MTPSETTSCATHVPTANPATTAPLDHHLDHDAAKSASVVDGTPNAADDLAVKQKTDEVLEPINLDDSMEQPNWRENPLLLLDEVANDALEVVLLKQVRQLDFYFSRYLNSADMTHDPMHTRLYIDYAMKISKHIQGLSDSIRKYRDRGHQEVVVKHQTVETTAARKVRSRVPPRRDVPPVKLATTA